MPLCTGCGRDNPADARFCSACGAPLEPQDAGLALELRKTVTVVFCDLVGSTSLGERLDPESVRRVMSLYFEAMQGALERHGGRVEKFIGDAVMAVFGVPAVHEDDALRAVRAADEMRAALPSLNEELERRWGARLQARIGVNTGEVVAGDPAHGDALVVVGDTVNVAARLEQAAVAGDVLLGASTYGLVRDAVDVEAVEPLALKGKSDPVPAFRLVAVRRTAAGRARRLGSPIVGRQRELELLEATFRRCAVERCCRIASVVGEAGVGKSRLTGEFIQAVGDRAAVVRGRCLPYGEGITFWPVAEIVKEAAQIDEGDSRYEARMKLHALLSDDEDETLIGDRVAGAIGLAETPFQVDETFWAVRRFLEILAMDRPLIVILDDIHWGEAGFLELVEYIAGATRERALMLLCMARPELREARPAITGGDGVTAVALEPLGEQDSHLLIEKLLDGAELPDQVSRRVARAAQGNPLFVEELLRMLVDDGLLRKRDGRWHAVESVDSLSVPPTVEALLAARLDRLQNEERAIIERAAVIGLQFWREAVAELLPEAARETLDAGLQALVQKQFVRRDDREAALRFTHILIRDVAYGRLLKESRSALHDRFATWLERWAGDRVVEYEEILGYHLEQAYVYREALAPLDELGRDLGQRAWRHLAAAGRRGLARGDMPAAASLLERASALVKGPERLETSLDLATALREAGALAQADGVLSDVTAAASTTGDERLEQHALLARAWFQTLTDPGLNTGELVDVAERAIAVFESRDDEVGLARAWHMVGQAHFTECRCATSAEALERALLHARRARDEGREAEILLGIMTSWYFGPTSSAEAIARCEEILGQSRGQPWIEASALNFLAGLTAMRARFSQARDLYARGRAAGSKFGAKVGMAAMALYSGEVEMLAGNYGAAERDLRRGREILVEIGETGLLAYLAALLAEAVWAQGRPEEAERFTEESAAASAEGDTFSQAAWRATRAKALAQRGRLEQAEEVAREAVRLAGAGDALNLRGDAAMALAEVLVAAERRDEAFAAYEAARGLYDRKGNVVSTERAEQAARRCTLAAQR